MSLTIRPPGYCLFRAYACEHSDFFSFSSLPRGGHSLKISLWLHLTSTLAPSFSSSLRILHDDFKLSGVPFEARKSLSAGMDDFSSLSATEQVCGQRSDRGKRWYCKTYLHYLVQTLRRSRSHVNRKRKEEKMKEVDRCFPLLSHLSSPGAGKTKGTCPLITAALVACALVFALPDSLF